MLLKFDFSPVLDLGNILKDNLVAGAFKGGRLPAPSVGTDLVRFLDCHGYLPDATDRIEERFLLICPSTGFLFIILTLPASCRYLDP